MIGLFLNYMTQLLIITSILSLSLYNAIPHHCTMVQCHCTVPSSYNAFIVDQLHHCHMPSCCHHCCTTLSSLYSIIIAIVIQLHHHHTPSYSIVIAIIVIIIIQLHHHVQCQYYCTNGIIHHSILVHLFPYRMTKIAP